MKMEVCSSTLTTSKDVADWPRPPIIRWAWLSPQSDRKSQNPEMKHLDYDHGCPCAFCKTALFKS